MAEKGQREGPCGDKNVLYLDSISVNILVVILHFSSAMAVVGKWGGHE